MRKSLLILIILPGKLWSQDSIEWKTNFINSLAVYRNHLIQNEIENTEDLKNTINKWEEIEPNPEILKDFIYKSKYAFVIKGMSYNFILKKTQEEYPQSRLPLNFSEDELQTIAQNSELVDLIAYGVLNYKYPFRIIPNQDLFDEIAFYDIQQNDIIAEIGAGNGVFSQFLSMLRKPITIYINEIDKDALNYIAAKKEKKGFRIDSANIIIVKGTKKEIKLPQTVDKIIIRNSFHHFTKKEQMLESIISFLNPEGKLFIFESLNDETNPNICKLKMNDYEIKSIFEENGFVLKREKKTENTILLEYALIK